VGERRGRSLAFGGSGVFAGVVEFLIAGRMRQADPRTVHHCNGDEIMKVNTRIKAGLNGYANHNETLVRDASRAPSLADPGWHPLARLDAATRFVTALVRAGGLRRGGEAHQALASILEPAGADAASREWTIPETHWSARPAPPAAEGRDRALLQGADLIILDESFAALDPRTLRRTLTTVLAQAPTVLVIAQP
jgi:hypothetical protein